MRTALLLLTALLTLQPAAARRHVIEVANPSDFDRHEIVEVALSDLRKTVGDGPFRLTAGDGSEIASQLTHDGKLIFTADVPASGRQRVTVTKGEPSPADTVACGGFYPSRLDDMAWENDRAAYRAYGPALQAAGDKTYGYDIWTKSVAGPVVARRYADAVRYGADILHKDTGNGMDTYTVGPTLGGGTAALLDSADEIVYPLCFADYEILDNGPLRFTVRLGYGSGETRVISLDAGEFLNRTAVRFDSTACRSIAPGIVIHGRDVGGYVLAPDEHYMAYADPTDNPSGRNGVIYVGVVAPQAESIYYRPFDKTGFGNSTGHILARSAYTPGTDYVYYWGSGWSKSFMPDMAAWTEYLSRFSKRLLNPLKTTIK